MAGAMKVMKPEEIRVVAAAANRVIEAHKNAVVAKQLTEGAPG